MQNLWSLGSLLDILEATFRAHSVSFLPMQTPWVVGFVSSFKLLVVGGFRMGLVGCFFSVTFDWRYSLLGVKVAAVWRGVGVFST